MAGIAAECIVANESACVGTVMRDEHPGRAGLGGYFREGDAALVEEAGVASENLRAIHGGFEPASVFPGQKHESACFCRVEHGASERVFGTLFGRCGELQQPVIGPAFSGSTATTLGLPSVSVPVLSSRTVSTWASAPALRRL